jgi:hypothetical protein
MILKNLILVLILAASGVVYAQDPGDFGDDEEDPNPTDEPSTPIGNYNIFLAISGVLWGAYKYKNIQRSNKRK